MDHLACLHVLLAVLACTGTCFTVVGVFTPGWFVATFQEQKARAEYTVDSLNRSIFYDVFCPQDLNDCKLCVTTKADDCVAEVKSTDYSRHFKWIEGLNDSKDEWLACRIIMAVVLVLTIIGFIIVLVLVCCRHKPAIYRIVAITGFIIWLLAGLLVWVPVGMVANMYVSIKNDVNANIVASDGISHDATLHVPYSVIVSAVGGLVAIVVALMLLWLSGVCRQRKRVERKNSFSDLTKQQEVPYTGPYGYYPQERATYLRESRPDFIPDYRRGQVPVQDGHPFYGQPNYWGQYDNASFNQQYIQ